VGFSVHLPTALEIASRDRRTREKSVSMVVDIIDFMSELDPVHHILHIPFTTPTLTSVPGLYFTAEHRDEFIDWTLRATESLETIQDRIDRRNGILVENINYSPIYLERFWKLGLCGFCLDMGHLMLGRESVSGVSRQFMSAIEEIHLHGVEGHAEHLSLAVLPKPRVAQWIALLIAAGYKGVINLEVFSRECLASSMDILGEVFQVCQRNRENGYDRPAFYIGG
jgi:sugar phosphate isomerase/epimerase